MVCISIEPGEAGPSHYQYDLYYFHWDQLCQVRILIYTNLDNNLDNNSLLCQLEPVMSGSYDFYYVDGD